MSNQEKLPSSKVSELQHKNSETKSGLSKKERRAQRIAASGKATNTNSPANLHTKEQIVTNTDQPAANNNSTCDKPILETTASDSNKMKKVENIQEKQKVGLSKKERRAQRVVTAGKNADTNSHVKLQAGEENVKKANQSSEIKPEGNKPILKTLSDSNKPNGEEGSEDKMGLSKKERRAQRVAVSGKNADTNSSVTLQAEEQNALNTNQSTVNIKPILKNVSAPKKLIEVEDSQQKDKVIDVQQQAAEPTLTKAQLKAQRRAVQEAQRAAKAATAPAGIKSGTTSGKPAPIERSESKVPSNQKRETKVLEKKEKTENKKIKKKSQFVQEMNYNSNLEVSDVSMTKVDPKFITLGFEFWFHSIVGSNARCMFMLKVIKSLIKDFEVPPNEEFFRSFENVLRTNISFLSKCRPLSTSMRNALKTLNLHLTAKIADFEDKRSDGEKKKDLLDFISKYQLEQFSKAVEAIVLRTLGDFSESDVILTYGSSSLIENVLLKAHDQGKRFEVIITDSSQLKGIVTLKKFNGMGINCTFVPLNRIFICIDRVTKVILGAHSVLGNGHVVGRAGTAHVALIASRYNKPVQVFCETFKFLDKVQCDVAVYNELNDPSQVVGKNDSNCINWEDSKYNNILNFTYDLTPPALISRIVTEVASLPCHTVPAILRIRSQKVNEVFYKQ